MRILTILTVFFSYLLISDFRLFSMKFKNTSFSENKVRFIFLGTILVLMILFSLSAITLDNSGIPDTFDGFPEADFVNFYRNSKF